jgi:hypothetical protein
MLFKPKKKAYRGAHETCPPASCRLTLLSSYHANLYVNADNRKVTAGNTARDMTAVGGRWAQRKKKKKKKKSQSSENVSSRVPPKA